MQLVDCVLLLPSVYLEIPFITVRCLFAFILQILKGDISLALCNLPFIQNFFHFSQLHFGMFRANWFFACDFFKKHAFEGRVRMQKTVLWINFDKPQHAKI